MKIVHSTPVLQSTTRTGKAKFWQGHVVCDSTGAWFTQSSYWQSKNDGTMSAVQWSEVYAVKAKNVGRSNETSVEAQAYLQIERGFKGQKEKGYAEIGEESEILPLPMLAHKFSDRANKLPWPAFVQPKLNGQRMLFDGEKGWSRGGKLIIPECIAHIKEELGPLTEALKIGKIILDGELILPGNPLLQKTMTAIKKFRPELSPTLVYWVYDVINPHEAYSARLGELRDIFYVEFPHVVQTPTSVVFSPADVVKYHKRFVEEGFEGSMVRFDLGGYDIGHRNNQLQKVKDFVDGEFEVLDIIEGGGRFKGAAIFECRATATETFTVVPEGDMDYRRDLYNRREEILSATKYLTVRYQELSKDGVPIFPVGVSLRETQDGGF